MQAKGNAVTPRTRQEGRGDFKATSVSFYPDNIVFLGDLTQAFRRKSKAVLERSALIRALITGLQKSKLDVTDAESEEALAEMIAKKLARK